MILCACGCGKLIHKYGSRGRLNKFAKCHRTITDTVSNAARKNQLKGAETRRNKKLTKEFLIEEYVAKKKSATEIANEVGCGYCTVYRTLKRYGIPTRGCKQENHGQWKGGMVIGSGGYIKIMMPQHPMANKSGYVAEHVLVVEKKYGRLPQKNEHVHHIDGDKQNNAPENLYLCTRNVHAHIHASFELLLKELMSVGGKVIFNDGKYEIVQGNPLSGMDIGEDGTGTAA